MMWRNILLLFYLISSKLQATLLCLVWTMGVSVGKPLGNWKEMPKLWKSVPENGIMAPNDLSMLWEGKCGLCQNLCVWTVSARAPCLVCDFTFRNIIQNIVNFRSSSHFRKMPTLIERMNSLQSTQPITNGQRSKKCGISQKPLILLR